MKWTQQILLGASVLPAVALAQDSLCDKYTKALLKDNTAENQYGLLVKLVNTALIGNYTQPNTGIKVNGILVPGTFQGQNVTLLPYFNGNFISTNRRNTPSAVNFIDDGGAIALAQDKPADGTDSNQYRLVTHLYQFFGALLGCSQYGKEGFPAYAGNPRMYELHKYMNINPIENGYFIQEVGLSAASFGVSQEDILAVASSLNNTFNQRCSPKVAVLPSARPDLQAICINSACPTATSGAVCSSYNKVGGFGSDPATATSMIGPQLTDLAPQLSSIAAGKVSAMPAGPMSFTTSDYSLTTSISGSETVIATETVVPIGGAFVTSGQEVITSGSSTITRDFTSTIPSSVVEQATTVISTDGSVITSTFPTTVANSATEPEPSVMTSSVESVITSVVTSGSSTITNLVTTSVAVTTTSRPNAAPINTAGPILLAVVGAGVVVQQML